MNLLQRLFESLVELREQRRERYKARLERASKGVPCTCPHESGSGVQAWLHHVNCAKRHAALLLLCLCLPLASCVVRPVVMNTAKGGYIASMGGVFAAKAGATVAEITTKNGDVIKFASESEDATDVPLAIAAADVSKNLANATAHTAEHAASTNSATRLGLGQQSVQRAQIKSTEKITLGTFVKPE